MKQLLLLAGCVTILSVSAGCHNASGHFPKVMVGVWDTEPNKRAKWAIKFETDGSIKRLVHPMAGPVTIPPGEVYLEGPDPDTHAIFIMGPCEAKYHRKTNELEVKIVLDYYEMRLPGGILRGRMEDYLRGPISKDGKSWEVDWVNYGWLEGATPPDPNAIEANPEKLVFTKIDIEH